jgi:hypothetical protein
MPSLDGETPSLGAGLSDAGASVTGDAPIAEEPAQAGDVSPLEAPKPTYQEPSYETTNEVTEAAAVEPGAEAAEKPAGTDTDLATSGETAGAVIALESRMTKPGAGDLSAAPRAADGLVTVRAKPEKRKNYKERAKEKLTKTQAAKDGTTPDTTVKAKSKAAAKGAAKAMLKPKAKAEPKTTKKTKSAARKAA